ncbi:MAG: OmpA family protein [Rubrivivax sp.]|nr:OmpA family protein [Rubrivivax sp.]
MRRAFPRAAGAGLKARLATAVLCAAAAGAAVAAAPVSDASVDDFVNRLSVADPPPAPTTRAFAPTRPPGADHQCAGNPGAARSEGASSRNFVAEYADNTPAQVDMALQFELGSDKLMPESRRLLDKLAQALNHPQLARERFAIAGHTDASGAMDLNLRLSCARAISARSYLVSKGVASQRLWAYGFGPKRLLADAAPDSPQHRRVEVRRAPKEGAAGGN